MKAMILRIEVDGTEADVRAALALLAGTMGSTNGCAIRGVHSTEPPRKGAATPGATGPVPGRKCDAVIEHAPESLGEMPAFFDRLDDHQLDTAWVACLIDCAARQEGRIVVSQLAAACNAVRARYRAAAITGSPAAEDAEPDRAGTPAASEPAHGPPPPPPPPRPPRMKHRLWPELLEDLLSAIPEVGDEVAVKEFATEDSEQANIRAHLITRNDENRIAWIRGGQGRNTPPAMLRRVML